MFLQNYCLQHGLSVGFLKNTGGIGIFGKKIDKKQLEYKVEEFPLQQWESFFAKLNTML